MVAALRRLPELLDDFQRRLAVAVSLPPTILFGEAPNYRCVGTPRSSW